MILKSISEAEAELPTLIEAVSKGEEILICSAGAPVAKLVRYAESTKTRVPGALRGKITLRDDFDEIPPAITAAFDVVVLPE